MIIRRAVLMLALALAGATSAAAQTTVVEVPASRPKLLMPLYVTQLTLHGLDVHSTFQALEAGHREGNPLLQHAKPAHMLGAKIASSAVTIFLAEKLWKKNRVAAVIMMAGVNAGLSAVVANNYRLAHAPTRN